jgi:hypothetical protein
MNGQSLLRLLRPLALLLLLAGVLLLGTNEAAWATPGQSPAGQTVPRREPQLVLKDIKCKQGVIEVEFNVERLRGDVSSFGAVTYMVNGNPRTAVFDQRTGNTARYVDTIPPDAPNDVYNVTSGSVTLIIDGSSKTFNLKNPGASTVHCPHGAPPSTNPLPPSGQQCAAGSPQRGQIGPDINVTVVNCPWLVNVTSDDLAVAGALEIRPVQPSTIPPANPGDTLLGPLADIVLLDDSGNPVASPSFANPIEVCYIYGASELAVAGNDLARLTIQFYDLAARRWSAVPTTSDTGAGRVCAAVTHLTRFALTTRLPVPSSLPNTGGAQTTLFSSWIWAVIVASLLAGGALVLRAGRIARR